MIRQCLGAQKINRALPFMTRWPLEFFHMIVGNSIEETAAIV